MNRDFALKFRKSLMTEIHLLDTGYKLTKGITANAIGENLDSWTQEDNPFSCNFSIAHQKADIFELDYPATIELREQDRIRINGNNYIIGNIEDITESRVLNHAEIRRITDGLNGI